jgi:hypothetical protein
MADKTKVQLTIKADFTLPSRRPVRGRAIVAPVRVTRARGCRLNSGASPKSDQVARIAISRCSRPEDPPCLGSRIARIVRKRSSRDIFLAGRKA